MATLADILGSTGAERRDWLTRQEEKASKALRYYLGPEGSQAVGGIARIAAELSPGADVRDAFDFGGETFGKLAGGDLKGASGPAALTAAAMGAMFLPGSVGGVTRAAEDGRRGFTVYHGSPHDFDRFDMSKIGTGEGAQAYGHGLYFAENEGVARGYRDKLSGGPDPVHRPQLEARRNVIAKRLERAQQAGDDISARELREELALADDALASLGRLYEVRIDADPADFLDWDAPLSAQPEKVRSVLAPDPARLEEVRPRGIDALTIRKALKQNEGAWSDIDLVIDNDRQLYQSALDSAKRAGVSMDDLDAAGESPGSWLVKQYREYIDLMRPTDDVSRMVKGREATLRDAGIPGIKYFDASSRGAGDGTRNYVVFDDRLITILRKYGIGAAVAGGAYALTADEYAMAEQMLRPTTTIQDQQGRPVQVPSPLEAR